MARTVVLHIGTHKTGSTALQIWIKHNRQIFPAMGIFVPKSGLSPHDQIGHHQLPAALLRGDDEPLDALRKELHASKQPVALLSSEELSSLALHPECLTRLREALPDDYAVKVLAYVRPQGAWAESLYGERVRQATPAPFFSDYVAAIIANGGYSDDDVHLRLPLDYTKLLEPFARVFGPESIAVRPYPSGGDHSELYRDFLSALAELHPPIASSRVRLIARRSANESLALFQLLETALPGADAASLAKSAFPSLPGDRFLERFRLISREETLALLARFAPSNRALEAAYGIRVPFIDESDLAPADAPIWETARLHRSVYDAALSNRLAN
jgi:hypothetical protein